MKSRSLILIVALSLAAGVAIGVGGASLTTDLAILGQSELVKESSVDAAAGGAQRHGARRGGERGGRVVPVQVERIGTASFADISEAVGSLRANQSITVVAEVGGRVEKVLFETGQRVKAGDVLVQFDDSDERIAVEEAQAALSEAEQAYRRQESLAKSRVATQAALEQAEAAFIKAKAAVARAEYNLSRRRIVAPFDGFVGLAQVDVGAWVDNSTVLTTLDDLSTVEVEFALPEQMLSRIKTGQPVQTTTSAFPGRTFEGAVSAIDTRVEPASRSFKVRAAIPNPDHNLKPGMFVGVAIVMDQRVASAVPEQAVITSGPETFVYVLDDGRAQRRVVQLGARTGDGLVEVVAGVNPSETVISSGTQTLRDGIAVQVLTKTAADVRKEVDS